MSTSVESTPLEVSRPNSDEQQQDEQQNNNQRIGNRNISLSAEDPLPDPAQRAMARAQVRAQAFVNRAVSSDSLVGPKQWPPLARKKSGELVKSSLRSRPQLTRAKSDPIRKAVHFHQKLEDVRPFRKTQRPSAVNPERARPRFRTDDSSTEGSLNGTDIEDEFEEEEEEDDNDDDDDYNNGDDNENDSGEDSGWTLLTPGFVPHRFSGLSRAQRPIVYLDSLHLSNDKSAVSGTIFVRNLAFAKHVAVRYTIDAWNTFSETKATWNDDVRKHDRDAGYDRFDMTLPLRCFSPMVLCDTVMFLCVRYNVNDEEFWDNNKGANYELYLRNSELLHALSSQKKKNNVSKIASLLTGPRGSSSTNSIGLIDSPTSKLIQSTDSVKEILKNVMLDDDETKAPSIDGPPGIPMKRHTGVNKSRYSFEASYAMPPQTQRGTGTESTNLHKLQPQYNVVTAQQLATSWMPQEAAVPMPAELKDNEHPVLSTPHVAPEQPHFHTWESQSYKEFVSKYCFYTPIPKSANKKTPHESSRQELPHESSPVHELPSSSAESSDIDLTSMRHDMTLAPEREANRV